MHFIIIYCLTSSQVAFVSFAVSFVSFAVAFSLLFQWWKRKTFERSWRWIFCKQNKNTLSKPNFYSLCTTMVLTLYDCSITISNSSHNSADACSHLFLSSIRQKLESKPETLDTQSPNHPINHDWATGKMRTQNTNFDCKSPLHKWMRWECTLVESNRNSTST